MNGKDLLALLVMIAPGFLLVTLIALSLVPASVLEPFPGSGLVRADSRRQPDKQSSAAKATAMREVPVRSEPVTQKRLRNPWEKQPYAKNLKASAQ